MGTHQFWYSVRQLFDQNSQLHIYYHQFRMGLEANCLNLILMVVVVHNKQLVFHYQIHIGFFSDMLYWLVLMEELRKFCRDLHMIEGIYSHQERLQELYMVQSFLKILNNEKKYCFDLKIRKELT